MEILTDPTRAAWAPLTLLIAACASPPLAKPPAAAAPAATVTKSVPDPVESRLPRFPVPKSAPELVLVAYSRNMERWVPSLDDFETGKEAALFCAAGATGVHCASMTTVTSFAERSEDFPVFYEGGARGDARGLCFLVPLPDGRGREGCKDRRSAPATLAAFAASGQWQPPKPVDFYLDASPPPRKCLHEFFEKGRDELSELSDSDKRRFGSRARNLQRALLGLIDEGQLISDDAEQITGWATMLDDGSIDGELTVRTRSKNSWLFQALTELRDEREADWRSFWKVPATANVAAVSFLDINWEVPVVADFRETLRGLADDDVSESMIERFIAAGMTLGEIRTFATEVQSRHYFWAIATVPTDPDALIMALQAFEELAPNTFVEKKRSRGLPKGSHVFGGIRAEGTPEVAIVPTSWDTTWLVLSNGVSAAELYEEVRKGKDLRSNAAVRAIAPAPSEHDLSFFSTIASPGYPPASFVVRVEDAATPTIVTTFHAPKDWLTGMGIHALSGFL